MILCFNDRMNAILSRTIKRQELKLPCPCLRYIVITTLLALFYQVVKLETHASFWKLFSELDWFSWSDLTPFSCFLNTLHITEFEIC